MSPFVLAVLFVPSFYILSSLFYVSLSLGGRSHSYHVNKILGHCSSINDNTNKDEDKPGLNCSAVILVIQIPIPSINANKMAPTAADLTAAEGPPINNQSTR